jgi:AraC family transcriptional regulator, transcriptional activator of pobA
MGQTIPSHNIINDNSLPFKVKKLDFSAGHAKEEAHRHNSTIIFIFTGTGGEHMIDFNVYPIEKNCVHFITEDQVHALNSANGTAGYVILFSKELLALTSTGKFSFTEYPVFHHKGNSIIHFPEKDFSEIEKLAETMLTEFNSGNPFKENIIGSYIQILLLKCKAFFHETDVKPKSDSAAVDLSKRFYDLIEKKFIEEHSVSYYAQQLNVTANYLSNTIKKVAGKAAGDIIHERIILEAKRRLVHTSVTAKELAYDLNFNDPSYFNRFFKSQTGVTPEKFRVEISKKYQH